MAELTISQIARQIGLQASAIRYYEQIGLLPRDNGSADSGVMIPRCFTAWRSFSVHVSSGLRWPNSTLEVSSVLGS